MTRNLIAILRGIQPEEIEAITQALLNAGIKQIEVPLNSPRPMESIKRMCKSFAGQGLFGAGTVRTLEEVKQLAELGADMVISPHCDIDIIKATKSYGMKSLPGMMTPSEAFTALQAGADGLKIFPGEIITPVGFKVMKAVLPPETLSIAVGGVNIDNFDAWRGAGIDGFGIGSALYKAGDSPDRVAQKAKAIVAAYDKVMPCQHN